MSDPVEEIRLDDPDTWPSWPILRVVRLKLGAPDESDYLEEAWLVGIESYMRTLFFVDSYRFHAAVEDPDYPLSNLPHKEFLSTSAILAEGWSPTI